jgi:hypothetical protein
MESTKSHLQRAQELIPRRVKRPDGEANGSSPCSSEVRSVWSFHVASVRLGESRYTEGVYLLEDEAASASCKRESIIIFYNFMDNCGFTDVL